MSRVLVYADVETTGLDENKGHVLEVGLLAVRLPTFEVVGQFSSVVVPPLWPTVRRNLNQRVFDMHEKSGLLADIDLAATLGVAPTTAVVAGNAAMFVQQWAPKTMAWHTPMAGANPSFDRKWIDKHMPALGAKFHYRHFELRTISFLQEWVLGETFTESPHRALADCIQANDTIRRFLGLT